MGSVLKKSSTKKPSQSFWVVTALSLLSIVAFYIHLSSLTKFPVFSDEAIYIRWAQLIIDDWKQYLFFPLNDGKTPLWMWLLVPFQFLTSDRLFSARLVSVLTGIASMSALAWLTKVLGGKPKTQVLSAAFAGFLPFWFFHTHLALIDTLLILLEILCIGSSFKAVQVNQSSKTVFLNRWHYLTGAFFGLALLTKVPAVLLAPGIIVLTPLLPTKNTLKVYLMQALTLSVSIGIGVIIFLLLRISPAFGQLFSRGSDFLYPLSDILAGGWRQTLPNIPTYLSYVIGYLTFPICLALLAGIFENTHQRKNLLLIGSALFFALPIMILGKVVYPRYFFPIIPFLTVAAAFSIEWIVTDGITNQINFVKKMFISLLLATGLSVSAQLSAAFILPVLTNPDKTPFVSADRVQYLTEWSSGHGIAETVALITQATQNKTIAVATEGSFGTLPDGLLLYFHRMPVNNLYIEGIGQPVRAISSKFLDRAKNFDEQWLVVNSHRLQLAIPSNRLLARFCRPDSAPCLEVWDITGLNLPTN